GAPMAWLIAAIVAARGPDAATSEAAAFRILSSSCFAGRGIPRGYPLQDCHTKLATGAYARDLRGLAQSRRDAFGWAVCASSIQAIALMDANGTTTRSSRVFARAPGRAARSTRAKAVLRPES